MNKALTRLLRTACAPDNIDIYLKKTLEILSGAGAFGPKDGLAVIPGSDSGQPAVFRNFTKEEQLPLLSGKDPGAGKGLFLKVPLPPGRRNNGMLAARLTAPGADPRAAAGLLELAAQLVSARLSHEKRDAALNRERDLAAAIRLIQELYLASPGISLKELSRSVLDEARRLTGSLFGFAGYLDADTGWLNVPTLTDSAWHRKCRVKGRPFIFKEFTGLWGWVLKNKKPLMTNSAAADRRASGLPPGHMEIDKFLAVPAVYRGKLLGILALANPRAPYNARDLEAATAIARVYAAILHRAVKEARLAEESDKRLAIISSSKDIIYSAGPDSSFTYVSPRVKDYGYTPEELAGRSLFDFIHPDDLGLVKATFARAMKTGRTLPLLCCRLLKKDGTFFYAEQKSGIVKRGGKPVLITGVIRDVTWKRGAETEIKGSEARYRALFNGANSAIVTADINTGTILDANRQAEILFGRTRAGLIGMNRSKLHPARKKAQYQEQFRDHVARGRISSEESLIIRKDGTTVPVQINAAVVEFGGKKLIQGIFEDISARKAAEAALRDNERFLSGIVDNIPNMVFVKDAKDLKFVKLNRAAEKLLGIKATELLGTSDYDHFPKQDADSFTGADRKVLASKRLLDIPEETIHTARGERTLHTRKIPILDEKGGPLYLLGLSEDITERRRLENSVIENERTLTLIFDTTPDPMFITDLEGKYLKANKACGDIFCLKQEELLGKTDRELFGTETEERFLNEDRKVLATGKTLVFTRERRFPSGTFYMNVVKTPLCDANGKVMGLLGVARDVTNLRKMETVLAVARAADALSKAARPLAHDFNNALTAINGYATLIDDELIPGHPMKMEISQIIKAVQRAADMTSRFQTFARNPKLSGQEPEED